MACSAGFGRADAPGVAAASPFKPGKDGVRVAVRVTPKARRGAIDGLAPEADGGVALKVAVTAAPEGGKANAAVIALLAKTWRLPKSAFSVASGTSARRKILEVRGEPRDLLDRLNGWMETQHG